MGSSDTTNSAKFQNATASLPAVFDALKFLTNTASTTALANAASNTVTGTGRFVLESAASGVSAPTNTVVSLSIPSTANGVAYSSGTTGTNEAFATGVTIGGGTNLSFTGQIFAPDGTSATPSYSFLSSTNTGFLYAAGPSVTLRIGASAKTTWDPNNIFVYNPIVWNSGDLTINREGAAILQQGVDSATAIAQVLKGPDGVGTDKVGGDYTFAGGQNTGTNFPGTVKVKRAFIGTSGSTVQAYTTAVTVGGTLKVDTTTTGNVGAGEDTLTTYTTPANQLGVNGDSYEFDVWGTCAANTNTKDVKVYYGATVLIDGGAVVLNGVSWRAHGKIVRVTATTQTASCELTVGGTLLSAVNGTICLTTSPAETLSGTVVFKTTGTSAISPNDNDIVQNGMVLKWYPGQ
jgi:hypothetical protein